MPKETIKKSKGPFNLSVTFDKASTDPVELMIYQDIGDDPFSGNEGFTAQDFLDLTKDLDKTQPIHFRLNSAGGLVWEGMAIKSLIDEWPGRKTGSIDGMAASVASWLLCNKEIKLSAPRHAQMFIHPAWGMVMGNSDDMRAEADNLEKTTRQIAEIYSRKTGKPVNDWLDLMSANSLFTAEEANQLGLIDELTDAEPVSNFSAIQVRNMKAKLATLNSLRNQQLPKVQPTIMNRKQKITLLNRWGVSTSKNATDAWIDNMLNAIRASLPQNAVKYKSGTSGDHAPDCDCADCGAAKNAPEPDAEKPEPDSGDGAEDAQKTKLWTAATANRLANWEKTVARQRTNMIQSSLDKLVEAGKLNAADLPTWMNIATEAVEDKDGNNPILVQLNKLPAQLPGRDPLNITLDDSSSISGLDKNIVKLSQAQEYYNRNRTGPRTSGECEDIANKAKQISAMVNRLKKYQMDEKGVLNLVGPLREAWDSWAASPHNANTMSTQLLRQIIMSEVMRAFRRQFTSLEIFCHNFGNIPLQGTDKMEVPYYPLDTVASSEFNQGVGYVINPNAQTLYKEVFVGGIGNGVATPGSGRKYKALQFSAYEIRRQPWLDIQKLSVMAGEQLAIDIRADILGTWINAANFGNSIWTGAAGGFDHTIVGNVLLQAAINAFWPTQGRNVVLNPAYYTNLAIDPGITALLAIGTTDILRKGIVGGLYGFESIQHDPLVPVTTSIRGGDGAVVQGTDLNLAGFMAWPSALLVATAPIMPPPGVLKKLVAYEQLTDDQTGLSFTYQFFGDETRSRDNEIIECSYGSGLGELKALFRLTSQGN
jgi:ATP-dependent protease ClpP protease subunit